MTRYILINMKISRLNNSRRRFIGIQILKIIQRNIRIQYSFYPYIIFFMKYLKRQLEVKQMLIHQITVQVYNSSCYLFTIHRFNPYVRATSFRYHQRNKISQANTFCCRRIISFHGQGKGNKNSFDEHEKISSILTPPGNKH